MQSQSHQRKLVDGSDPAYPEIGCEVVTESHQRKLVDGSSPAYFCSFHQNKVGLEPSTNSRWWDLDFLCKAVAPVRCSDIAVCDGIVSDASRYCSNQVIFVSCVIFR